MTDLATNYATETVQLPSGKMAVVREMTGREEDLLSNEKLMRQGKATDLVLQNVIVDLNGEGKATDLELSRMLSADREAIMIHTRVLSYGEIVESELECEDCKKTFTVDVDLSQLEFKAAPENLETQVKLSDKETVVTLLPMTGADEKRLFSAIQEGKDVLSSMLMVYVKQVGDLKANQIRPWIQNLRLRDRTLLRSTIKDMQYGYQTQVTCTCPACNAENKVSVVQLKGFFFPEM